uniref:Uncharacterized protein n=1 Tax=Equus caballus TaxID=9796 RepID=A0A3Q2GS31_HORSE
SRQQIGGNSDNRACITLILQETHKLAAALCAAIYPLELHPFSKRSTESGKLLNYYLKNEGQVEDYSICFLSLAVRIWKQML